MALLTDDVRSYIGRTSEPWFACDAIEAGAVRRYAQAIMDPDPAYAGEGRDRFGGPVAPPLYPAFMFRLPLGSTDCLTENAENPDFDGLATSVSSGLPELPLPGLALLNGGAEECRVRRGSWWSGCSWRTRRTGLASLSLNPLHALWPLCRRWRRALHRLRDRMLPCLSSLRF